MLMNFINRYSTPFTTGLFLASLISGVALFFHYGAQYFHAMHEWLSMLLIVPFVFHVWKNWGPLSNYLKRGWLLAPLGLSLAAMLVFAAPAALSTGGGAGGGNPAVAMGRVLAEARISDFATMTRTAPEVVQARLKALGIEATSLETTISAAAKAAGKDAREAVMVLVMAR
jgi:hypothetical protein